MINRKLIEVDIISILTFCIEGVLPLTFISFFINVKNAVRIYFGLHGMMDGTTCLCSGITSLSTAIKEFPNLGLGILTDDFCHNLLTLRSGFMTILDMVLFK